jgi:FkbM family methyltransferase
MKNSPARKFINSVRNSRFHYFLCRIVERFEMEGFTISYSQCGEDLILKSIFGKTKRQGLYVDIGCNNPIQKSNTFKLYLKGWNGICADGNAALMKKFKKIRTRDICLTEIVSDSAREVTFYQDDINHEMSSVDSGQGTELKAIYKNLKEIKTYSTTLAAIFDQHVHSGKIDLLCIDVEHHDLEVLKGNDFDKYRPEIICVEFDGSMMSLKGSELDTFLTARNYTIIAFSSPNVYYRDKAFQNW